MFEYYRDEGLTKRAAIYPSTLAIIIQEASNREYSIYAKKFKLIDDNQREDNQIADKLIKNKRGLSQQSGADLNKFLNLANGKKVQSD